MLQWIALGIQALSAISGASAKRKEGKHNQAIANFNADQFEKDATRVRSKTVEDDRDLRMRYSGLKASQRAQLAANGVFVDSGTASQIQDDTDFMMELDSFRIRKQGAEMAESLEERAANTREHGVVINNASQDAAVGQLLSGAGAVASSWYSITNSN